MKVLQNIFLILSSLSVLICTGCSWFRPENRPAPVKPPYPAVNPAEQTKTEEELINDIVSEISLQIAISGRGPFHVIPTGKTSPRCRKVIHALESMELIKEAGIPLYLYETTGRKNRICLKEADKTKIFYEKNFSIETKGANNAKNHNL